jgi:hypothetical protein
MNSPIVVGRKDVKAVQITPWNSSMENSFEGNCQFGKVVSDDRGM